MGQSGSVSGDGPSAAAGASLAAGVRHAFLPREREDLDGSPRPQGEGNSQSVRNAIDIYIESCLNSNNERETSERVGEELGRGPSSEPGNRLSIGDSGQTGPAVYRSNSVSGFSKYLMNKMQDMPASAQLVKGANADWGEDTKVLKDEVKMEPPASTTAAAAAPPGKENVEMEVVTMEEAAEVKTDSEVTEAVEIKTDDKVGEDKDETSSDHTEIVDVEKMTPPPSPGRVPKSADSPGVRLEKSPAEEKGGLTRQPAGAGGRDSAPFNCQSIPLQVIIDRVLDSSLGEDSSLPKHLPPITTSSSSPLSIHRQGLPKLSSAGVLEAMDFSPSVLRAASAKQQDRGLDSTRDVKSGSMKVDGKNLVFLMDHIERVLESSFANNDSNKNNDSEEEGAKLSSNSCASSSATLSRTRSPPPDASAAWTNTTTTSSSKSIHEGSISVQDIVNRVISQTEVISKSSVPHSLATSSVSEYSSSSGTTASASLRPPSTDRGHPSSGVVPRPDIHPEPRHHREEDKGYHSAFSPGSHGLRHLTSSRLEDGREASHQYRMDHPLGFKSDMHQVVGNPNSVTWLPTHMTPIPLSMAPYSSSDVTKSLISPNYFKMPGHPATRQPPPLIRGDKLHEMPPHPPTKGCYCASCTMAVASGEGLHDHAPLGVHRPPSHGMGQHSKHQGYPLHTSLSPYTQPLHPSPQFNSQLQSAAAEKHPSSRDVPKTAPAPHTKGPPSAAQRPMYLMPGISTGVPPRPPKAQQVPLVREMVEVPSHGSISRGEPVYPGSYIPYGTGSVPHAQALYPGMSLGRSGGSEAPSSGHILGGSSHGMALPEAVRPERKRESILDLSVKGLPEPLCSPSVERASDSYPDEQPLDLSKKPSSVSSACLVSVGQDDSPYAHHPRKYLLHEIKDPAHFHPSDSRVSPLPARPEPAMLTPVGPGHVALPAQQAAGHPGAAVYPQAVDFLPQPPRGDSHLLQPGTLSHPAPFSTSPAMTSFPPLETSPLAAAGREPDSAGKGSSDSPVLRPPPSSGERQDSSSSGSSKRTNVSRHEPLQNIIGSHPANDILFLRCLMCNQTYGSPYGFRKHFRNQHGFEPKAEHAEVASISAERSLRQGSDLTQDSPIPSDSNSYSPGTPDLMCGLGPGEDSAPKQDLGPEQRLEGGSGKPRRSYSRGCDGRPQSAEDGASEDKCLRCQTCGQSFQLNDFGGFKRHNRQHNQSRSTGLYSCPECHLSLQDPMLLQEHIASAHRQRSGEGLSSRALACKVCGERFSSAQEYDQHLVAVHNRRLYSCELCTAYFLDSFEFEHHLQSAHGGHSHGGGRLLDIQRLPADAVTTTASPDSSSDNAVSAQEQQPSSNTPNAEDGSGLTPNKTSAERSTVAAASSTPKGGPKVAQEEVSTSRTAVGKEEEKDGESGRRSCSSSESRTQSCESHNDASSQASPCGSDDPHPDVYYKHKKFALHRKRPGSMDSDAWSKKGGDEKDAYDSSDSNSLGSCPERKKRRLDAGCSGKAREASADSHSEEGASKEAARGTEGEDGEDSQQGVVWDRVTRSQAGKIIKPPDYMT